MLSFLEGLVTELSPLKREVFIQAIKKNRHFFADQYKISNYIEKANWQKVVACHLVHLLLMTLVNS